MYDNIAEAFIYGKPSVLSEDEKFVTINNTVGVRINNVKTHAEVASYNTSHCTIDVKNGNAELFNAILSYPVFDRNIIFEELDEGLFKYHFVDSPGGSLVRDAFHVRLSRPLPLLKVLSRSASCLRFEDMEGIYYAYPKQRCRGTP